VSGAFGVPWYIAWPLVGVSCYGALWFYANRSVYYPLKYPQGFWSVQAQLHAEDVWLPTSDGVQIHAWWVRQEGARLATLYLHGNAGNVTHRYPQIREITAAGSSILMLDYRGYGRSAGWPTEKGLYTDAETAYQHLLKTGYRPEQIILHGESIGSAVAVHVASRSPCAGVVLEAPFTSARDVARSVLPVLGPMLIWSFDSVKEIGRVRAPLLFIQGDRDEIIPLRLGRKLFAAAPEPKSFWIVEGARHNDILEVAGQRYRQRLRSFYQGLPAFASRQFD
jgi:fermentation-respiration switch protein FrsA (DUF1100 family)